MLAQILADAARSEFPSPDGSVTVGPQPSAREAGYRPVGSEALLVHRAG